MNTPPPEEVNQNQETHQPLEERLENVLAILEKLSDDDRKKKRRRFFSFSFAGVALAVSLSGLGQYFFHKSSPSNQNSLSAYDNTKIAFASNRDWNWEIYCMNVSGKNLTNITNNPADDIHPAWSPSGKTLVFASNRHGSDMEIYLMDVERKNIKRLTDNQNMDGNPEWSPDGARIAFVSDRDGNLEIYVMNADGIGQQRVTNNRFIDSDPAWSHDGTKIVFVSDSSPDHKLSADPSKLTFVSDLDRHWEIYTIRPDGLDLRRLTDNSAFEASPTWSPDGKKIAFTTVRRGFPEIYTMNPDGSDQQELSAVVAGGSPSYSPDGMKMVLESGWDGKGEIYVMNADGSHLINLTNAPPEDKSPAWSPFRTNEPLALNHPMSTDIGTVLQQSMRGRGYGYLRQN